jgi:hypothetical protein
MSSAQPGPTSARGASASTSSSAYAAPFAAAAAAAPVAGSSAGGPPATAAESFPGLGDSSSSAAPAPPLDSVCDDFDDHDFGADFGGDFGADMSSEHAGSVDVGASSSCAPARGFSAGGVHEAAPGGVAVAPFSVLGASAAAAESGFDRIESLLMAASEGDAGDYAYFAPSAMRSWAGPQHWRPRALPKASAAQLATQASGNGSPKRSRGGRGSGDGANGSDYGESDADYDEGGGARAAKAAYYIDFAAPPVNRESAFAPPPRALASTQLAPAAVKASAKRAAALVLPTDMHYSLDDLSRLFLRPRARVVCVAPQGRAAAPAAGGGVATRLVVAAALRGNRSSDGLEEGELAAPAWSTAGGSGGRRDAEAGLGAARVGLGGYDDDDGGQQEEGGDYGGDDGGGFDGPNFAAGGSYGGVSGAAADAAFADDFRADGLLAPQRVVERIDVGYATVAKKVDVKKLKVGIWTHIEQSAAPPPPVDAATGRIGTLAQDAAAAAACVEPLPERVSFVDTVVDMAPQVPSNVSVSFYFICLLHLANEKGLELQGEDGLNDFSIRRTNSKPAC